MSIINEFKKASSEGGSDIFKVRHNFMRVLTDYFSNNVPFHYPSNKIVLIGGGSGTSTVGRSLYRVGISNFTSIANVMDVNGGSGIVQNIFSIPHMNDVAQHLININPIKNYLAEFMSLRTSNSWRQDGYLILAAAIELFGIEQGIDLVSHFLENTHRSLPITDQPCEPVFTYHGIEYETYEFAFLNQKMGAADHVKLNIAVDILPGVKVSIKNADVVILGPGDIHFSTLPPMLVPGVYEALNEVRKIILITNLTARKIDIPGFTLRDFIAFWKDRLPKNPEYHILVNSSSIINQGDPQLKDDVRGDYYMDYNIHRAKIAGIGISRNKQLLHDEHALGKSLRYLMES